MNEARVPDPAELLDLVQDALFVIDEGGTFLLVSAGCQYLLGYRPAEMLGRNMIEFLHPEDRERTLTRVWQIMAGISATRFRNRWFHKLGHPVEIEWACNWSETHRVRVATARAVEPPEA
jgi:PAS domain S-box-containing protein